MKVKELRAKLGSPYPPMYEICDDLLDMIEELEKRIRHLEVGR